MDKIAARFGVKNFDEYYQQDQEDREEERLRKERQKEARKG